MIRFGIMGAGSIAVKFCEAVHMVSGVEVLAIASKSAQRAESFAAAHHVPNAYGNYEDMLRRSDIDVVYIATTCNFHYENCMQCIAYGKAILCEKSMVETQEQAQKVFRDAARKNVFVMEAMWSRFLPAVRKAKAWIAKGRIGTVQLATYTGGINAPQEHRIFKKELGGGALMDLTVYPIEIVTYLIPQTLQNVKSDMIYDIAKVDVTNSLLLQYETCRASIQCTALARVPSPSAYYGANGYIRMEQTHRAAVCELYDAQFQLIERFEHPVKNGFEFEIAEVRDCLLQGKLESDIMPHAATLQCLEIFEICRKQGTK